MSDRTIFNYVDVYRITAVCETPLHIGSAEGDPGEILIHPVTHEAFIQATGLAGSFREYVKNIYGEKICKQWFGSGNAEAGSGKGNEDGRSRIVFTDGIFQKDNFKMELRTRVSLNNETGTTALADVKGTGTTSGQLLETEYISRSSQVCFEIYEYYKDTEEQRILRNCLAALDRGDILIGGQLSNGCGQLKLQKVDYLSCNMATAKGRKDWISLNSVDWTAGNADWKDILGEIHQIQAAAFSAYDLYMAVTFDRSVLVKGDSVDENLISEYTKQLINDENRAPDVMQVMDGNRKFIIPGSSLKGVFRNRIEMIASYKKLKKELMDLAFENRSKLFFYDTLLENDMNIIVRNHIDKFTGSVMGTGLFKEAVNGGNAIFHIRLMKAADTADQNSGTSKDSDSISCWNEAAVKQLMALLLLTMRDCAIGAVNVGSGFSIGRGFMTVHKILAEENGKTLAVIYPEENQIEDSSGFISECLQSIQ